MPGGVREGGCEASPYSIAQAFILVVQKIFERRKTLWQKEPLHGSANRKAFALSSRMMATIFSSITPASTHQDSKVWMRVRAFDLISRQVKKAQRQNMERRCNDVGFQKRPLCEVWFLLVCPE
jgi:hypothetical protein